MYVRIWASTCESFVCMDRSVSGCIVHIIHTYLICVRVSECVEDIECMHASYMEANNAKWFIVWSS